MARITAEDCVLKVPNRFELVALAAERARQLAHGSPLTVSRDDDKNPVVALREIAEGTVDVNEIRAKAITGYRDIKFDLNAEAQVEEDPLEDDATFEEDGENFEDEDNSVDENNEQISADLLTQNEDLAN